jgi:hypothetical protein
LDKKAVSDAWSGIITPTPDMKFLAGKGKELGVNAILLVRVTRNTGKIGGGEFVAFIVDPARRTVKEQSGTWLPGALPQSVLRAVRNLLGGP